MYTKDYKMLGFTVSSPKYGSWKACYPDRRSGDTPTQSPENCPLHRGGPGIDDTKKLEGPCHLVALGAGRSHISL